MDLVLGEYEILKQKKERVFVRVGYATTGRFLIAINIRVPTIATATIIAIPTPKTYISVGGRIVSG